MTYYVLCNVLTGSVLDVSYDVLNSDGHPVTMKVFDGDIPDPLSNVWDKVGMRYVRRETMTLTHIQFRKLFTQVEELQVDTFNDTYQGSELLNDLQKAMIRTGLKKYHEAQVIELNDPGVGMLLDLYISVGILQAPRKPQILNNEPQQT